MKKSYAIIHFEDKKPIKKPYDTAVKAFYDYENKGCCFVELFDYRGVLLSSTRKPILPPK